MLPLHVAEAVVADPVGLLPTPADRTVTGHGLTFAAARLDTARRAVARYASLMVDPRLVLTTTGRPAFDGDPVAAVEAMRSAVDELRVPGYGLVDGAVHLVPLAAVFPTLVGGRPPAGLAAGYSWHAAVSALPERRARPHAPSSCPIS